MMRIVIDQSLKGRFLNYFKKRAAICALLVLLALPYQIISVPCVPCVGVPPPPQSLWSLVADIYATQCIGTLISGPITITTPGIYTVCQDITSATAGPLITIATGNAQAPVLINLACHTISITNVAGQAIVGSNGSLFSVINGTIISTVAGTLPLVQGAIDVVGVDFAAAVTPNTLTAISAPAGAVPTDLIPRVTNCSFRSFNTGISSVGSFLEVDNSYFVGGVTGISMTGASGSLRLTRSTVGAQGVGSCVNFTVAGGSSLCVIDNCEFASTSLTAAAVVVSGTALNLSNSIFQASAGAVLATGLFPVTAGTTAVIKNCEARGGGVAGATYGILSYDAVDVTNCIAQGALLGAGVSGLIIGTSGSVSVDNFRASSLSGQGWGIGTCNTAVVRNCIVQGTLGVVGGNACGFSDTSNVYMEGCIVDNVSMTNAHAIAVSGVFLVSPITCIIKDCAVLNCSSGPGLLSALIGLTAVGGGVASIQGCRVTNGVSSQAAIQVQAFDEAAVKGCSIEGLTGAVGIEITNATAGIVQDCNIVNVFNGTGVFILSTIAALIDGCIVDGLTGLGGNALAANLCNSLIIRNSVVQNTTTGGGATLLGSSNTPFVLIEGCSVNNASIGIGFAIQTSQSTDTIIRDCDVQDVAITVTGSVIGIGGLGFSNGLIDNCRVSSVNAVNGSAVVLQTTEGVVQNTTVENATVNAAISVTATNVLIKSNNIFNISGLGIHGIASATINFLNNVVQNTTLAAYVPAVGVGGTVISVAGSGGNLPVTTGYWANVAP